MTDTPAADPLEVYGTREPPPERRRLSAGALSAVLEAGQLRDIRWHGVEVVRGIAWILRDAGWGTVPIPPADLVIEEGEGVFRVTYGGCADTGSGRLSLHARIEGTAEGHLQFEVEATAESDVVTNRAGFVVLHPDGAAGLPLEVGHPDGSTERSAFPLRISPDQPAFDIVALVHEPAPGLSARVAFEGGTWEMEDQRNWADASFKTYVRPLALPFPYRLPSGSIDRQAVTLAVAGRPGARLDRAASGLAPLARAMPPLHLRLPGDQAIPGRLPLRGLAASLILRTGPGAPDRTRIAAAATLADREGASLCVEAVFDQRDPEAEAAALLSALEGWAVEAILVAAARDRRTRPSNTLPPGEAPLDETVAALRRGFAGRIGTGVPAFFTEFNRNPPPEADLAFFGVCPLVHAADDASAIETLGVLPAIMDSATALRPGVGLWPGPLALGAPVNPYGSGPVETDGTTRTPLASRDPRHGALFGAAHLLAALAAMAPRAEALAPLHATGPLGLSDAEGRPLPLAFVHAELARARGATLVPPDLGLGLTALAWEEGGRRAALVASLDPEPCVIDGPDWVRRVDRLAPGPGGWEAVDPPGGRLTLGPFAVLRLRGS